MCTSTTVYPTTTTIAWPQNTTYIYSSGSYGHTKCANCGYCTCCSKADILGAVVRDAPALLRKDRVLADGRGVDDADLHLETASGQ